MSSQSVRFKSIGSGKRSVARLNYSLELLPEFKEIDLNFLFFSGYGNYNTYGSYGLPYRSPYSSFGSFGSSYGGYGGYGGYNSYNSLGGYPGQTSDDNERRFIQYAEEKSRSTFASVEGVVRAFNSLAMMVDNTFFAMTSSFRAVLSVAENFGRLRTLFGHIWYSVNIFR